MQRKVETVVAHIEELPPARRTITTGITKTGYQYDPKEPLFCIVFHDKNRW